MMARDVGPNAVGPNYMSPPRSAFEGPLPPGRVRWFPRVGMIELVLDRVLRATREG